ncbi:hypothetical protein [Faecalispora jeddahensis]|uniref:hypothetical protein n=1 Tax=Faecalispora jeddahensis TaxID=1414721 RepID=UPI0028ADD799|nr:hypothetical protein [Faecalispora jeddahensis]
MNISDYDVIYKEVVYKCVNMMPQWKDPNYPNGVGIFKPAFMEIICVDSDGQVITICDEAFMFRFIRKAGDRNG